MKRRYALVLGLLSALSWVGSAAAGEPVQIAPAPPVVVKTDAPVYGDHGPMCGDCCQPACGGSGLNAGIGFYYIQPSWESNPAIFSYLNNNGFLRARQDDFSYDYEFAPRVWIGFNSGDAGIRARFWRFDQSSSLSRIDTDGDGNADQFLNSASPLGVVINTDGTQANPEALNTNSDLQLEVWDVEGTYNHKVCGFDITYFGGLRYVHLSQSYTANVVDSNTGTVLAALSSGHNINAWGITGGVETRRALGCSGLSLYGSGRTSLLYGTGRQTAASLVADLDNGDNQGGDASRDDLLPILEAELGAEFNRDMGGMNVFFQAALVGQVWFGAGNASRSTSPDVIGVLAGGTEDDCNLGFFGITISGGLRY